MIQTGYRPKQTQVRQQPNKTITSRAVGKNKSSGASNGNNSGKKQQDLSRLPPGLPFHELPHRNPNNRRLTLETVNKILHRFGVSGSATNLDYYQRAFTQKSFELTEDVKEQAKEHMQEVESGTPFDLSEYTDVELVDLANAISMQPRSSERLEFMGDTVLSTASSDYLFRRYPDQEEGFLDQIAY